ncbi:MAG: MFS transporter [Methanobrevibacter sp.]|jgi:EmrB/QacA subfamily drug resistance transporter|nr:MFS transporter [Methanobrevibacter sp.]
MNATKQPNQPNKSNKSNQRDSQPIAKDSNKKFVIIAASIAAFLVAFSASSITVALPPLAIEFSIDAILQNWVATSFLLSIAVFSVPFGKLSGKFGLKKTFILGILIFAIASIGAVFSFSAYSLIFFRVVQGLGSAILNVTSLAMITESLPPKERGKGIGINISSVYVGLTLAPVIGGILTYNFGWQSIFLISIPFLIITTVITIWKIPEEWTTGIGEKFDYLGTIIYTIAILLLIYGFTIMHQLNGVIILIIAIILFAIFAWWELRNKFPVFNVKLFKNPKFTSSSLASLISYLATFVVTYIINYHLQYIKGFDPQIAGLILIVTPAVMAIISPFAGRLSDKIDPQILAAIGMGFVSVALFILVFLDGNTPISVILIAMFLQGIGYGLFSSPNINAIMGSVPRKLSSVASAAVSTMRVIGQTLSLGMLTVIFAVVMGSVQILPQYFPQLIESSQIACIISTILCIIAIMASLVGIKSNVKVN